MAKELEKGGAQRDIVEQHGGWNELYRDLKPEDLPWNAGGPDSELVRLVESGAIPVGRAIDIGTGPGHDAIYLAQKRFKVLAIDIAPAAIELARANAKTAGTGAAIDFRLEDVLKLSSPAGSATFVNDRGCFHVLRAEDRQTYVGRVADVLFPKGLLFLRTFSEAEPPGPGPYRFTRKELEDAFSPRFDVVEFKEGVFEGPRKPKAHLCLFRKRA
jgi:SAM-dependent methyltransferase